MHSADIGGLDFLLTQQVAVMAGLLSPRLDGLSRQSTWPA